MIDDVKAERQDMTMRTNPAPESLQSAWRVYPGRVVRGEQSCQTNPISAALGPRGKRAKQSQLAPERKAGASAKPIMRNKANLGPPGRHEPVGCAKQSQFRQG